MIIVSQDRKELINFDYGFCLSVLTGTTKQIIQIDGHKIGEYKTEERAKEILENIISAKAGKIVIQYKGHKHINDQISRAKLIRHMTDELGVISVDNDTEIKNLPNCAVFYMPEE